jgi:hypothetical protein
LLGRDGPAAKGRDESLYFAHSVGIDGKATSPPPHEIEASSFDQAAEKAFGKGVVKDPSRGALVGTIPQIDAEGRRKKASGWITLVAAKKSEMASAWIA